MNDSPADSEAVSDAGNFGKLRSVPGAGQPGPIASLGLTLTLSDSDAGRGGGGHGHTGTGRAAAESAGWAQPGPGGRGQAWAVRPGRSPQSEPESLTRRSELDHESRVIESALELSKSPSAATGRITQARAQWPQ